MIRKYAVIKGFVECIIQKQRELNKRKMTRKVFALVYKKIKIRYNAPYRREKSKKT